jgi:recombinational DNA repair protein (RecF pathway)
MTLSAAQMVEELLRRAISGVFDDAETRTDMDMGDVRLLVFERLEEWFIQHPGIEDHTTVCIVCKEPATKANRIESTHSGTPRYLCERCCDGITGAPVVHSNKLRIAIGNDQL